MEKMKLTAEQNENGIRVYLNGVSSLKGLLAMHTAITYAVMDKLISEGGMEAAEAFETVAGSCRKATSAMEKQVFKYEN